jgi:hypothetical protein
MWGVESASTRGPNGLELGSYPRVRLEGLLNF